MAKPAASPLLLEPATVRWVLGFIIAGAIAWGVSQTTLVNMQARMVGLEARLDSVKNLLDNEFVKKRELDLVKQLQDAKMANVQLQIDQLREKR